MALNINYQGNTVDENGNSLDCYYQAYSNNIGKWGDIHQTDTGQYNVNFGDGDLNTQSGSVHNGDVLLIVFWTGGDTRNDELTIFSVARFIYNGNDSTVQDIQLMPPFPPSCSFGLPSTGLNENTITATSYASLTHQWTYSGFTLYHRRSWYGQTVLGYLDIQSDEFDFGDGYGTTRTHQYTASGDYVVKHEVFNTYNLSSECQKNIRIFWRSPIAGLSWTPTEILLNDEVTVNASIQDIDNRITAIRHIFDSEEVDSNTTKDYSYAKVVSFFGTHVAKQEIDWNDGFADHTITYQRNIPMTNQPPTVDVVVYKQDSDDRRGVYKVFVSSSDIEGPIVSTRWKIYYHNTNSILPDPYFQCMTDGQADEWRLIYDKEDNTISSLDLVFAVKGEYRISVTVKDEGGLTATDTEEIDVLTTCVEEGSGDGDCPPEIDVERAIAVAIQAYIDEENLRKAREIKEEISDNCKMILVNDSLATEMPGGEAIGVVQATEVSGNPDGNIGGSTLDGVITGDSSSISGN